MPHVDTLWRHWPWVALLGSVAMLAIAHAFETFGRLAPCELCLKERANGSFLRVGPSKKPQIAFGKTPSEQ